MSEKEELGIPWAGRMNGGLPEIVDATDRPIFRDSDDDDECVWFTLKELTFLVKAANEHFAMRELLEEAREWIDVEGMDDEQRAMAEDLRSRITTLLEGGE